LRDRCRLFTAKGRSREEEIAEPSVVANSAPFLPAQVTQITECGSLNSFAFFAPSRLRGNTELFGLFPLVSSAKGKLKGGMPEGLGRGRARAFSLVIAVFIGLKCWKRSGR
jgi:hypothetical protein